VRYDLVEAGFDPSLGFVVQRGIHRLGGSTAITPRPRAPGIVRRWEFNLLSYNAVWDLDGRLDNALFMVRPLGAQFQSGDRLECKSYAYSLSEKYTHYIAGLDGDFACLPRVGPLPIREGLISV
jgi:hypothetical protein